MPDRNDNSGQHFGSYAVVRPIGSGGMGMVYEAEHRALGRRAALKVLHRPASIDPAELQRSTARFLREGRAAAQVRHPHVIDVYDFGVEDGRPYLVMELVEGETFASLLQREGALTVERLVEIFLPVLSAVAELHAMGIIHRDLKPANVLLARERTGAMCPKLGDFGVSRVEGDTQLTQSGVVLGTPLYMSPELTQCAKEATELSDQYALGVMLYEAATGERPFTGTTSYELMHAIVTSIPPAPRAIVPSLPERFERIVLRAMARAPADRFDSIDELAQALLPFASAAVVERWRTEFAEGTAPAAVMEIGPRRSGAPRRWPFALGAVGMAIAIAGLWHRTRVAPAASAASPVSSSVVIAAPPAPSIAPPAPSIATSIDVAPREIAAPPASSAPPRFPPPRSNEAPRPPPVRRVDPERPAPNPAAAHARGANGAPILEVE
jgi:serine/threonine-protein kinase